MLVAALAEDAGFLQLHGKDFALGGRGRHAVAKRPVRVSDSEHLHRFRVKHATPLQILHRLRLIEECLVVEVHHQRQ